MLATAWSLPSFESIQVLLAHARDAFGTGHPQPALVVFQNIEHLIAEQALLGGEM